LSPSPPISAITGERRERTGEGSRGNASDRRRVAYVHVGPHFRRVAPKTSA